MFKIGNPVYSLPPKGVQANEDGRYADIYKSIDKLSGSDWLPVTFESAKDAYNFRIACETHRTRLLQAVIRKSVVYVRNRK
jgi:hypothetical protein